MHLTFHSATSDGHIQSASAVDYATARNGTGILSVDDAASNFAVGQRMFETDFYVYEGFLNFNVSSLVGEDVTTATLSLWLDADHSDTDFTLQARLRDWGDTLDTGDFVAGASLSSLTLLASIASSGIGAAGGYKDLISESALLTAIEAAAAGDGILRLILCSDRTIADAAPTGPEYMMLSSAEEVGTAQDPMLVVTTKAFDLTSQQPIFVPAYGIVQHQSSTAEFVSTGD